MTRLTGVLTLTLALLFAPGSVLAAFAAATPDAAVMPMGEHVAAASGAAAPGASTAGAKATSRAAMEAANQHTAAAMPPHCTDPTVVCEEGGPAGCCNAAAQARHGVLGAAVPTAQRRRPPRAVELPRSPHYPPDTPPA